MDLVLPEGAELWWFTSTKNGTSPIIGAVYSAWGPSEK
jgi:hypothetical protein